MSPQTGIHTGPSLPNPFLLPSLPDRTTAHFPALGSSLAGQLIRCLFGTTGSLLPLVAGLAAHYWQSTAVVRQSR